MSADLYLKSINSYHEQFKEAYDEASKLKIESRFPDDISDLIVAGMGGSSFGARIIQRVFQYDRLLIPMQIVDGYDLPAHADEKSLVLLISYSGNTEEVLKVAKDALEKGCKLFVITTGGKLKDFAVQNGINYLILGSKYNGSKVSRTGIGYVLGATLGVLNQLKVLEFSAKDAQKVYRYVSYITEATGDGDKIAVQVAQKMFDKVPVFIGAEHTTPAIHIWRNFLNETAKQMAFCAEIPEMNHHLLDGLLYPKDDKDKFILIFINSSLYGDRVQKRIKITRDVATKHGFQSLSVTLSAKDRLNEVLELVVIGSLVSFNLARIHRVDPSANEMVDYLKKELSA